MHSPMGRRLAFSLHKMAIVNQKLWISSAGVPRRFQNVSSPLLAETVSYTLQPMHQSGLSSFCFLECPLTFIKPASHQHLHFSLSLSRALSRSPPIILTNTYSCFNATCPLPHPSTFYHSSLLYQRGASSLPPLTTKCYGSVVNSGLDLLIFYLHMGSCETRESVPSMSRAESKHNRFFFMEVSLFSFFII